MVTTGEALAMAVFSAARTFTRTIPFGPRLPWVQDVIPILQMRKQRLRKARAFVSGHMTRKWKNWDFKDEA